MKVGIMQPYFLPYLGYWQLMNAVDVYVLYDNIEFTKNSWMRRNRILSCGADKMFSLPLKRDSDYLDVKERFLADDYDISRKKLISLIENSYKKAPEFATVFPIVKDIFECNSHNLFDYIHYSIEKVREYLGIQSNLIVSSTLDIDWDLKGKDKVLAICKHFGADEYYNSVNGIPLYEPHRDKFAQAGIELRFPKMREIIYPQFKNKFVPNLSIIDVMMFNSQEECQALLREYDII